MLKRIVFFICLVLLISTMMSKAQYTNESDTSAFVQADVNTVSSDEEDDDEEADTSVYRSISENKWRKIEEDKSFIYRRENDKKKDKQKKEKVEQKPIFNIGNVFSAALFKIILFILLGVFLIIVIYHLFLSGEFSFLNYKKRKPKEYIPSFEQVEEFSEWDKALNEALSKQDYRLAVRILYLETLQKLNAQGMINYQQDKTNWDYVRHLTSHSQGPMFTTLTRYFDYVWYGSFVIGNGQYKSIETSFRTFQQEIR